MGEWELAAGPVTAVRQGVRPEPNWMIRLLHDTVLQSLEAMALGSGVDAVNPAAALAEVRAAARAEAARLRRALHTRTEGGGLAAGLGEVVREATLRGLRVRLVSGGDLPALPAARRDAVCGAVREALRNVGRHAGTTSAVVRVEATDGVLRVVVRDHGRGFAAGHDGFGFGIRESIIGRLDDVGGWAAVESAPGAGTRVTMGVPLDGARS